MGGLISFFRRSAGCLEPDDPGVGVFDTIKTSLNAIKTSLDTIKPTLDAIKSKLDAIKPKLDTIKPKLDTIKPLQDLLEQTLHRTHRILDRLEAMLDPDEFNSVVAVHLSKFGLCRHVLVRTFKVRNAFHIFDCHFSESLKSSLKRR